MHEALSYFLYRWAKACEKKRRAVRLWKNKTISWAFGSWYSLLLLSLLLSLLLLSLLSLLLVAASIVC